MTDAPPGEDERALRLIFTFRGEHVELLEAQRVAMFIPVAHPPEDPGPRSGFWVELRDHSGAPVFLEVMHHPMASDWEVFPADPAGEIVRQPVQERSGAFTVVVPEREDAVDLVLMGSRPAVELRNQAATEVARFEMATLRRQAEGYGRP